MTPAEKKQLDETNARMRMAIEQKAAWFDVIVVYNIQVSRDLDGWSVNIGQNGYQGQGDYDDDIEASSLLEAVKQLCEKKIKYLEKQSTTSSAVASEQWKELYGRVYGLVEPDGSFDLKCECCGRAAIGVATVLGSIKHASCEKCVKDGIMPWETLKIALKDADRSEVRGWTETQLLNTCNHFGKTVEEFWDECKPKK